MDKTKQTQQTEDWEQRLEDWYIGEWLKHSNGQDDPEIIKEKRRIARGLKFRDFLRQEIEAARREAFEDGQEYILLSARKDMFGELTTVQTTKLREIKQKYLTSDDDE